MTRGGNEKRKLNNQLDMETETNGHFRPRNIINPASNRKRPFVNPVEKRDDNNPFKGANLKTSHLHY
jgi:hypothetical protein